MKEVKVSVIIPVYNEESYLRQCLDSILTQTLREIEVLCVDDGSTDCSLEILEEYAQKDSRVVILKQENRYAGMARNLGMRYATGKYYSFLDADDFFSPCLLEKLYDAAEKYTSDIVMCNILYYDCADGKISKRNANGEEEFLPVNRNQFHWRDIPDKLFQITNGWAWDKLFLGSFIQECNLSFSHTRIANDGYFVYMALARARRITKIDDYLVTQRINNKYSLSNTRELFWYCGIQMVYEIKHGLETIGLYDCLSQSFLNFSLKYLLWAFEHMESWNIKRDIYQCIREECRQELGITDFSSEYYYNKEEHKRYVFIEDHSFEEYLLSHLEKSNRESKTYQQALQNIEHQNRHKIWPFPYARIAKGSRVILYGAGSMGQDYYRQIEETGYCEIVLWLDRKFEKEKERFSLHGWKDDVDKLTFDKVVIALFREEKAREVMSMLLEWGIPEEKMVWKI